MKEIVVEGRDVMTIEGGLMEKAMKSFRPLVDSTVWDYCVVWKLGNDPSRFIEWMGCFCSGADCGGRGGGRHTVKEENLEEEPLCRDVQFKHPMRTKACEALACFPFFLPLYSGTMAPRIQGEVVISRQPKWLTNANASDSNSSSLEPVGTRVLIPVIGGLIELFASKAVEKDQTIIELIAAQFKVPINPTAGNDSPNLNLNDYYVDASLKEKLQNLPPTGHLFNFLFPVNVLPQSTQPHNQSSFEGSSSGSINAVKEHSPFGTYSGHVPLNECSTLSVSKLRSSRKSNCNQNLLIPDGKKKIAKATQGYRSKNLEVERKRRIRINEGLLALRAMVPKISKMDKTSILGDAIEYISELQNEKKKLEDELKQIEEEQWRNDGLETSVLETLYEESRSLNSYVGIQGATGFGEKLYSEVELELNQISERDYQIKLVCEHKRGGFRRLMEVLHASGLHVLNANIATSLSKDLNILHVQAHEHVEAEELREALIRMTMTE